MPLTRSHKQDTESFTCRGRTSNGFTLVELLVVIAILALLFALLQPAVTSAMAAGKTARCSSQLMQIGAAAMLYAGENSGMVPHNNNPADPSVPEISYDDRLSGYDGRPALTPAKMNAGQLFPHDYGVSRDNNLYLCPSETWVDPSSPDRLLRSYMIPRLANSMWPQARGGDNKRGGLYGAINGEMWVARFSQVPKPSQTILLCELRQTWMVLGSLHGGTQVDGPIPFTWASQLWRTGADMAHQGKWNYLFCDGHIELIDPLHTFAPYPNIWTRDPND